MAIAPFLHRMVYDFKVYSSTIGTTIISHVTLVTVWYIAHVASPSLEMLSFQGSCLCELMYCDNVSSGMVVALVIVRSSASRLD